VNLSVKKFSDVLASDQPYPGGGAASAVVAEMGIDLTIMVARIVSKRNTSKRLRKIIVELDQLRKQVLSGVDGDVRVYKQVVAAYSVKKDAKGRAKAIQASLMAAYVYMRDFAKALLKAAKLRAAVGQFAKGSIASDLVLSKHFLDAAFSGALQTARVNVDYFKSEKRQASGYKQLEQLKAAFERI